jgi:hypothetical protein
MEPYTRFPNSYSNQFHLPQRTAITVHHAFLRSRDATPEHSPTWWFFETSAKFLEDDKRFVHGSAGANRATLS